MSPQEIVSWRKRVEVADVRGHFLSSDYHDAGRWNTCAVGEQHRRYPKVVVVMPEYEEPRDRVLSRLGVLFSRTIEDGCPDYFPDNGWAEAILRAYEILDLIEARVMALRACAA